MPVPWRRFWIALTALIVVMLISLVVGWYKSPASVAAPPQPSDTNSSVIMPGTESSSATPSSSPSDTSDCPAGFVQVNGNNANTDVDADMTQKYNDAVANLNAGDPLSKAEQQVLLTNAGNNAHRLAIWSHAVGLNSDPNDEATLEDGDCLSAKGQQLYYAFKGALTASGTTVDESNAPANGYNSGVDNGQYGQATNSGVTGNTKSIHVTLANGTQAWIMIRCGNPVYPSSPGLPMVKTDNTPKNPSLDPNKESHVSHGGVNANSGLDGYVAPSDAPKPGASSSSSSSSHSDGGSSSSSGSASSSSGSSSSSSSSSTRSTPPPEQGAPGSSDAPSTTACAPGVATC